MRSTWPFCTSIGLRTADLTRSPIRPGMAAICAFQPKMGFDELRNFSLSNASKRLGSDRL
jgi:hypothetical protein